MLDNVPIMSPVRDQAWEKWIKRKTVVAFMKDRQGFKFPLDGSFDVWCVLYVRPIPPPPRSVPGPRVKSKAGFLSFSARARSRENKSRES